jgi:uncharacterized protein (TIGR02001 family)
MTRLQRARLALASSSTTAAMAVAASAFLTLSFCSRAHAADEKPAEEATPPFTLTGHIDLVTRYYLRGATKTYGNGAPLGNAGADAPESDKPVAQWGADFVHSSGLFAGYWGSMINYSYKQLGDSYSNRSITDFQKDKSIENDLYGGYNGSMGDFTYTAGGTYYAYINGSHANAFETKLGAGWGPLAVNAQTLLNDVVWGNKGDTYWTFVFTKTLPYDLTFTANLGYYTYKKEGKYLGTVDTLTGTRCAASEAFVVNGCFAGTRPVGNDFRHMIFGISQPILKTGLTWSVQGIVASKNRYGIKQANKAVASISYAFP